MSNAAVNLGPAGLSGFKDQYSDQEIDDDLVLTVATTANVMKIDGGASNRDVSLPPVVGCAGVMVGVINGSSSDVNLVVKDQADAPNTIGTVGQNTRGDFYCDGTEWVMVAKCTIALS